MSNAHRTTTIFAKKPEAGAVKTRLAPRLVGDEAAAFALAMLDDTVAKCVGARARADANAPAFETVLCVAPAASEAWFRERYPRVARVLPQIGADLGQRLARHAHDELHEEQLHGELREQPLREEHLRDEQRRDDESRREGARVARTLVVIGSDAPHARVSSCIEAHEKLERGADLVLGLDDGGGYHLIGMRRAHVELFTNVAMSTPEMALRTLELARRTRLDVAFVESEFDVDEPHDVERLKNLFALGVLPFDRAPRTAAFLTSERA